MSESPFAPDPAPPSGKAGITRKARLGVLIIVQLIMAGELVVLIGNGRWMHVFLVIALMGVILAPMVLHRLRAIAIPSEIHVVIVLFGFASLFLGEIRDYYERIWWWDLALHSSAGLLLGMLGFLVVYMLNEDERVDLHMQPSFVALFAFMFSVGSGGLWEIFEFSMDQIFGLTMQKPMLGDSSGLTDTMWDMIVNAIGAAIISLAGWRYMRREHKSYVDSWARRFVERNPQLFERTRKRAGDVSSR